MLFHIFWIKLVSEVVLDRVFILLINSFLHGLEHSQGHSD